VVVRDARADRGGPGALDTEHVPGGVLRPEVAADDLVTPVALVDVVVRGAVRAPPALEVAVVVGPAVVGAVVAAVALVVVARVGDTGGAEHRNRGGHR